MKTLKIKKMKGQIAIVTGIAMVVLIGSVGLALDSGLGYIIKAKLNAAVDAASIAAARSVVQGNSQSEQIANAQAAASKFFAANYPNNYMNSVPTLNTANITFNQGQITIDVSATSKVPVNFMGLFGFTVLNVSATAQTIRKDIDMAFVLDTTGSMSSVGSQVKTEAINFLTLFNPLVDRIALMHFAEGGHVDVPFNANQSRGFNRTAMNTAIQGYSFGGFTNYAEGLWLARDQLNNVISSGSRSSLRAIVFFSDGSPNTIASFFTFKNPGQCSSAGSIASGDTSSGTISGLYRYDQVDQQMTAGCWRSNGLDNQLTSTALPAWYNAHNKTDQEFQFAPPPSTPAGLRAVTTNPTYTNINNASRNIAEEMAWKTRQEGIYIFTLGLGTLLHDYNGPNNEYGEDLLKCMANTPDAPSRCTSSGAGQPVGVYCWARTAADLGPCFSKLASEILRLSK
ncbi:MAG: VWA domain-containing protein [Formivibrio sp.]|nr:VWA domain-containing protein [Formivibrio sp.]